MSFIEDPDRKKTIQKTPNAATKKLWDIHQANEQTAISRRQEGLCFGCAKIDYVLPTIVDICADCAEKKNPETLLALLRMVDWGYCYFCGKYKQHLRQINARVCQSCNAGIRLRHRDLRRGGGTRGVDPFWHYVKRHWGKDWQLLWTQPQSTRR